MLATTRRWQSTARLGMALSQAGCTLVAVCPPTNPLRSIRAFSEVYPHNGTMPLRSLNAAMRASQPDLIVPCDDLTTVYLHRLHATFCSSSDSYAPCGRELIERSIGNPSHYTCIESRSAVMAIAREEGIPTPDTAPISTEDEIRDWISQHQLPAVLKADGTTGGDGVRVVSTPDEAIRAFQVLNAPLGTALVLKRVVFNEDLDLLVPWLRHRKRTVSVQSFVYGRDATIAFACWQGNIIASISLEVLQTSYPRGPSAVVRVLDDEAMLGMAQKLAKRLRLSGICGLDFMIQAASKAPYLMEVNPRATHTCHLALGRSHDIPGAIYSALSGEPAREVTDPIASKTIVLFPNAWQLALDIQVLRTAYHDVPWEEAALVREGVAPPSRVNRRNWIALKERLGSRDRPFSAWFRE